MMHAMARYRRQQHGAAGGSGPEPVVRASPAKPPGGALAAAVVATALTLVFSLPAAALAAPARSVSLPPIPSVLGSSGPCTAASQQKAVAESWAQSSLSLPQAWKLSRGAGVTVGLVDTGVAGTVSALSGRVTAVGAAAEDCVGHGSFMAGLIAAGPTAGVAFEGVAPQARIVAVRGTSVRGAPSAALLAAGIRAAVDQGAGVVAVPFALPSGEGELTSAVRYAAAHDALVVASAAPDVTSSRGGAGAATTAPPSAYWPAAVPGVLSVVGVGPGNPSANGSPAAGTGTAGAGAAGAGAAAKADLAAPGEAVVGVGPRGPGHFIGSGSSLATAFVAGAAALVRSYRPGLTAAQTAAQLTATAYPTSGAPRLDPYGALSAVLPASPVAHAPVPAPPVHIHQLSSAPRHRALLAGGIGAGLVVLVAAAAAIIPRGRARGWRPPGRPAP